jgi:hypothetical protein
VSELIVLVIDMIHPADDVRGEGGAGGEAESVAGQYIVDDLLRT